MVWIARGRRRRRRCDVTVIVVIVSTCVRSTSGCWTARWTLNGKLADEKLHVVFCNGTDNRVITIDNYNDDSLCWWDNEVHTYYIIIVEIVYYLNYILWQCGMNGMWNEMFRADLQPFQHSSRWWKNQNRRCLLYRNFKCWLHLGDTKYGSFSSRLEVYIRCWIGKNWIVMILPISLKIVIMI